jgi:tetratricopeptide (TPR) repeat protein
VIREAVRLGDHELAFDLAGCMEKHSDLRGMYLDWAAINAEVMAACRHAGNHLGEAAMLRGLIDVTTWTTDRHDEEAMGRQRTEAFRLLEMFVRLGHGPGESDAAVMCAWACAATGEHHRAVELATRALRVAERSGHRGGEIRAHLALAVARFELNDLPAAVAHAARALDAARALGNARGLATALQFCGIAYRELGDFPRSSRLLDESLSISRQYHDDYTETLTMLALARLHLQSGDPRARQEAEASLALSRQYGLPHHRAESLQLLGEIELAGNRPTDAVGYLEQSVDIWRSRGWHSFQAAALTSLGRAYLCVDRSAARTALAEAVAIYSRLGHEDRATEVRRMLPASGTVPDVAEQPAPPP